MCVPFLACSLSAAQVTGVFSLDKPVYAVGEPVFLNLTLTNQGSTARDVERADPFTFCSGYIIKIERQGTPHAACSEGFAGSCMSGAQRLEPHASHTERILLNYPNRSHGERDAPVKLAGDYTVDALRNINFFIPAGSAVPPDQVHQVLTLRVDDTLPLDPGTYAPYIQDLASKDWNTRRDAARVLAALAPPALEPLLLTFATAAEPLKQFAPLALANLGTKTSMAALAEVLTPDQPGTYVSMTAAGYLGETHDPQWMPALLAIADHEAPWYLGYAAQSGGDAAIVPLLMRMHSADANTRSQAISALRDTGSRAAVPVLLSLLLAPVDQTGDDVKLRAQNISTTLQLLTHRTLDWRTDNLSPQQIHQRWQQWWFAAGRDAPIYKPGDCAEYEPLP